MKLFNSKTRLTITTLVTWTFLFDGTVAENLNQRCYACGPQAGHWFPDSHPPHCENFTESEEFTIDCGDGFDYCAVSVTPKTYVVSRICSNVTSDDCNTNWDRVNENTLCTCNGSLCNGVLLVEQMARSHPKKGHMHKNHLTETSGKPDIEKYNHSETTEIITTNSEIVEETEHSDPIMLSNNVNNSKVETGIHIMPKILIDEDTGNSLPMQAAVRQNNKQQPQGAPVDDEEDASEGSGNRIESEQKTNSIPATTTTEQYTSTAKTTKNSAPINFTNNTFKILIWTLILVQCILT